MTKLTFFGGLLVLVTGCSADVVYLDDERAPDHAGIPGVGGVQGIPCDKLVGEVTLTDYNGDNYASSAFSFEFATQDPDVTRNDYDLLYEQNTFAVNLVTDDRSFVVDLGEVALDEVPEEVNPNDFPRGQFGEHEYIDAVLDHAYYVRSTDSSGRHVGAFRVVGLDPGYLVSIAWVRSPDPDVMVLPVHCGL